jgi:hypothetical protein
MCTIMRNMSGLMKNSRVVIEALHDRYIFVRPAHLLQMGICPQTLIHSRASVSPSTPLDQAGQLAVFNSRSA